jgi:hypothetical protein
MADREHRMHACSPEKRDIVDARSFFLKGHPAVKSEWIVRFYSKKKVESLIYVSEKRENGAFACMFTVECMIFL